MPATIAPTVTNQMTRKHFEGIAGTLQLLRPDPHGSPAEFGQWVLTVAAVLLHASRQAQTQSATPEQVH